MTNNERRRSCGIRFRRAVALGCLVLALLPGALFGTEKNQRKVVRVAYQEFNRQFEVDAHKEPVSGYAYEYIETVGTYAGWEVKYIPCDSFSETIEKLLAGEVDLVYDISYTKERAKDILFPDEPMGREYYYLYTSNRRSSVDYQALNGKIVGATARAIQVDMLRQWCQRRNVTLTIVEYEDPEKKEADLHAGKIDLDLEVGMLAKQDFSAVTKIGSSAYYLVASKKRPDLINDINIAVEKILNNDLYHFTRLQEKYFSDTVLNLNLSVEEVNWLKEHRGKTLRVGFFDHYLPFCANDEKGNPIGAGIDAFRSIIEHLGLENDLKVEFVSFDDQREGYKAVESGEIDLLFPAYISHSVKQDYRIVGGRPLAVRVSNLAFAGEYKESRKNRIAVNRKNLMQYYYCKDYYPNSKIVFYDGPYECLDGLLEGTADGTFLNGIRSEALLRPRRYRSLHTVRAKHDYQFYMAFAEDNLGLMLLMDRGLTLLEPDFINLASYGYVERIYSLSLMDFLEEHMVPILIAVALLAAMIVTLIGFRHSNRKLGRVNARLREEHEKLIKAEKARSYFFSTVSHDIRTPLNAIIGFSEMLQLGIKDPEEKEKALDAIVTSAKTLLELINDVLDLSKLEVGKMELRPVPTDISLVVRKVVSAFEAANAKTSIQLRTEIGKMPLLKLDPQRIRQILFNLIGNAVKFTAEGSVTIRASYDNRTFTLSVTDTGCGISQENIGKLMSPYVQLLDSENGAKGTGLGLAICKQLATQMRGTLEVESELGQGSTFTLRIPEVEAFSEEESVAHQPQKEAAELDESITEKHLLIVDDQKLNLKILQTMLNRLGIRNVLMAENGKEALEKLRQAERVDMVLTDMSMPIMDGAGLVREIRRSPEFTDLPVYVITADVEMQAEYERDGFDALLIKPITLEKLKGLLARSISPSAPAAEA
ncbi:MAG: transporter substrate-binding domain-containing protein [Lentisphaeria bacterium]|nr:transporter substrate-binding domain-containing protein [Lentisphaeria bacterium]